jgi:uncharacterized protein YgbK (DUF1537 family)
MIAEQGAPTALVFGPQPPEVLEALRADAIVVCFKSRSVAAGEARTMAASGLAMLARLSPRQIFFKYCSTFDSTPAGNIGPAIEELLARTGAPFTVAVPALPVNGRTQYLGHLFVNGIPLHESSLARHPLNPMSDSNLLRWLGLQTSLSIGLVPLTIVRQGPQAIRRALHSQPGARVFFLDATEDGDLEAIAAAVHDLPFLTGGSGLGAALPRYWPPAEPFPEAGQRPLAPRALILSGSCSDATLSQLEELRATGQTIVPLSLAGFDKEAVMLSLDATGVAAIASSSTEHTPDAAAFFERNFGEIAQHGVDRWGVERIIVAGGETSGAVVSALKIPAARLVSQIAPGVPALLGLGSKPLGLALKSGNFGGPDFFEAAQEHLARIRV